MCCMAKLQCAIAELLTQLKKGKLVSSFLQWSVPSCYNVTYILLRM